MKVTLGETRLMAQGLAMLMAKDVKNIKVAYKLSKTARAVQAEADLFEEQRMRLIRRYATQDGDGAQVIMNGNYQFGANLEAFDKEFKELAATEVSIKSHPFTLSELESAEISIAPAILLQLGSLIDGGEEDGKTT
jgi:hypothetical protein